MMGIPGNQTRKSEMSDSEKSRKTGGFLPQGQLQVTPRSHGNRRFFLTPQQECFPWGTTVRQRHVANDREWEKGENAQA